MHRISHGIYDIDGTSRDAVDNKYHCPTCNAAFTRRSNLRRHHAIHTRLLGYKCEACAKAFPRSDQLRFHADHCPMRPNSQPEVSTSTAPLGPQTSEWDPRFSVDNPSFLGTLMGNNRGRTVPSMSKSSNRVSTPPFYPPILHSKYPTRISVPKNTLSSRTPSEGLNSYMNYLQSQSPSTPIFNSTPSPGTPYYDSPTPNDAFINNANYPSSTLHWSQPGSDLSGNIYSTHSNISAPSMFEVSDPDPSIYAFSESDYSSTGPPSPAPSLVRRHSTGSSSAKNSDMYSMPTYTSKQMEEMFAATDNSHLTNTLGLDATRNGYIYPNVEPPLEFSSAVELSTSYFEPVSSLVGANSLSSLGLV